MNQHSAPGDQPVSLKAGPQYDTAVWYLVVNTTNNRDPRVLKNRPDRIYSGDVEIELRVRSPKTQARKPVVIEVDLPNEENGAQVMQIRIPDST